jgi:putative component of toxin-antitoxin plasmid stabilization module
MVEGKSVVALLCGGDKATQQRDIRHAREYLTDYQRRPDA